MSAAVGASTNLDDSGAWAQTYRMVRSLTLLGAKAAGVVARAGPVPADRPELQVGCKHTMPTYADCDSDRTVATFFWARAEHAGTKVCADSAFDSIAGSVMIARLGRSKQFKLTEGPDNFRHLPLL